MKMIKECIDVGLPQPLYYFDMSGFFVNFRKDIFSEKYEILRRAGDIGTVTIYVLIGS